MLLNELLHILKVKCKQIYVYAIVDGDYGEQMVQPASRLSNRLFNIAGYCCRVRGLPVTGGMIMAMQATKQRRLRQC